MFGSNLPTNTQILGNLTSLDLLHSALESAWVQSEKFNSICRSIPMFCRSVKENYERIKMLKLRTASDAYSSFTITCSLWTFCNKSIIHGASIKDNGEVIALLEGIEKSVEQMGVYKNSIYKLAHRNMHMVIQIELDAFCIENKIEHLPNTIHVLLVEMVLEM